MPDTQLFGDDVEPEAPQETNFEATEETFSSVPLDTNPEPEPVNPNVTSFAVTETKPPAQPLLASTRPKV